MSRSSIDSSLLWSLRLVALAAGAIVLFIMAFLIYESLPAISELGPRSFLSDSSWHPGEGQFNLVPMVAGTLLVSLGAVLVATPLGVLSAIFCNFNAPAWLARPYRGLIELLAGIPSVVYGFWGLVCVVPWIARFQPPGASLLAGILILCIMILPTIALLADGSISRVPADYNRAALALGFTPWAAMRRVVLPSARPGIAAGVCLAGARALGETMAVLLVCGNVVELPRSLFDPIRTLTANIALEMAYATGNHRSALFLSGLLLLMLTLLMFFAAQLTGGRRAQA